MMSTYKVISDVEVEDKLIGPLTFKQFIYALIAAGFVGLGFLLYSVTALLVILVVPFVLFFLMLAFYRRVDQPAEVYLASLLTSFFKSKYRIWDRGGVSNQVEIQVPKKIATHYTDGLTSSEVRGQLKKLSQIVDTRGWASRNSELQLPSIDTTMADYGGTGDDRLVGVNELSSIAVPGEVLESDDIYSSHNQEAARINSSVHASVDSARAQAIKGMRK